jgi:hypothetical protein|tara:strand:- start:3634 stop:3990 length:357 start_codon:yes stop_codon:yes gene_type:complete
MIQFGENTYYIDIDKLESVISTALDTTKLIETKTTTYLDSKGDIISVEIIETSNERVREVNAAKYDLLRTMVEVVLDVTDSDELDATLGADRGLDKSSLSFKIAFNTLYEYGILKEKE